MGIGFRVCQRRSVVRGELVEKFRGIPVANISDVMARVIGVSIPPIHNNGKELIGAALTVRTRPGDNLMVHKALDMAGPGDVVVVDAGGEMTSAIFGELMADYAHQRGVSGIVIYGAIRDATDIRKIGLAVHALGNSHRGPYKDGPGEINVSVSLGGMVVEPGDLVIGDEDGVVCVPQGRAEDILQLASAKRESEIKQIHEIRAGKSDRSWVDRVLKERGCQFEQ